jgi:hypothetical protein
LRWESEKERERGERVSEREREIEFFPMSYAIINVNYERRRERFLLKKNENASA